MAFLLSPQAESYKYSYAAASNKKCKAGWCARSFDVLMAVAGIATVLTTGNPFIFALAVADIGLATSDIAINTFRKEIEDMGGKEFLDTWEKIYLVGTLATATPAAIGSLFKLGNALIKAAIFVKNADVRNFVMAILFRIILDRNIANFTRGNLKSIITDYDAVRYANVVFKIAGIERLEKAGVAIFKLVSSEGEEIYIAYYKDQIIAKGAAKDFRDALKDIWDARNAELLEKLNAILNRRRVVTVEDITKLGEASKSGAGVSFKLIDEFGNFMGELTRINEKANKLVYRLIQDGKKIDIKSSVELLDFAAAKYPLH